jgi:hypothetical protein
MGLFSVFKRKEGGTAVGNLLRGVTSTVSSLGIPGVSQAAGALSLVQNAVKKSGSNPTGAINVQSDSKDGLGGISGGLGSVTIRVGSDSGSGSAGNSGSNGGTSPEGRGQASPVAKIGAIAGVSKLLGII